VARPERQQQAPTVARPGGGASEDTERGHIETETEGRTGSPCPTEGRTASPRPKEGTDSQSASTRGTDSQPASNRGTDSQSASNRRTDSQSASNRGTDSQSASNRRTDSQSASNRRTDSQSASNRGTDNLSASTSRFTHVFLQKTPSSSLIKTLRALCAAGRPGQGTVHLSKSARCGAHAHRPHTPVTTLSCTRHQHQQLHARVCRATQSAIQIPCTKSRQRSACNAPSAAIGHLNEQTRRVKNRTRKELRRS